MIPSLRLVRRACAYAYARLFRFRSAAGPAVVWQTAAGVNRALGAGLAAGKALVCGPDEHRRKRKHERGMRFRFITASSVSGRPFSGVFPPCRGGMLERKKAPSPAGAPTLLFCAPSRTALPRPMQRRSPPLCPFSLCPCVRQPTTAVDHACAHAVPQSACVSASRRSVPGPMGRRRPLFVPWVPCFLFRLSLPVRPAPCMLFSAPRRQAACPFSIRLRHKGHFSRAPTPPLQTRACVVPSPARPSHPVPSALFFCCFCAPLV